MARAIVKNAKLRRTGICGAAETLLVDRAAVPTHLKPLVAMLIEAEDYLEVVGEASDGAQTLHSPANGRNATVSARLRF